MEVTLNRVIIMKTKYGQFSSGQIKEVKKSLRSSIFFILLCIDPATAEEHKEINVDKLFDHLLYKIDGLNELLMYQKELVNVMSLLQEAKIQYNRENYDFGICRKLILDAGSEVLKLQEGDADAL